ncbi:hypothetical protein SD51_01005 [Alicyclobacillus tengchongensis]|nr:hypothetical protein SD51_01005 [Alicyclobacillus tengchongensis]
MPIAKAKTRQNIERPVWHGGSRGGRGSTRGVDAVSTKFRDVEQGEPSMTLRSDHRTTRVCAIYARVSDESQVHGDSLEHQIAYAREYARLRASDADEIWLAPDELVYVDEGITGLSMVKRPAVLRLLDDAKLGRFDVLLCKGISRFARDTVDALTMLRLLIACGVRVLSIEENFDSDRDRAEFVFTIHSALAQAESEKTSVRVRLGAMQKARSGRWNGRPPDGYRLNRETQRLEVDDEEAPIIRQIFAMYRAGVGCRAIAERLNRQGIATPNGKLWSQRRIARILQNPVYCGEIVYGRRTKRMRFRRGQFGVVERRSDWVRDEAEIVRVFEAHPAIIDRETFAAVAHCLEERRLHRGRVGSVHLLVGLARCVCGGRLVTKENGRHTLYYRCARQAEYGRSACNAPYVRADDLEQAVIQRVREDVLTYLPLKDRLIADRPLYRQVTEVERSRLVAQFEKLFAAYASGALSLEQFDHLNGPLRERLASLEAVSEGSDNHQQEASLGDLILSWLTVRPYESEYTSVQRRILAALVQEVRLTSFRPDISVSICYTFSAV